MTIRAHFDGKVLVPEEPLDLPIGQSLELELKQSPEVDHSAVPPGELPSSASQRPPNEAILAALRRIDEIQQGMNPKRGVDSQVYIREARAGALYGYEPTE